MGPALVAEEAGDVLGDIVCHVIPLPHRGPELLLYSIGVRAAHRRRGIGRALVAEMFRWAAAYPMREVWVLADPEAEAFYEACGFRRGAEEEQGTLMLARCNI